MVSQENGRGKGSAQKQYAQGKTPGRKNNAAQLKGAFNFTGTQATGTDINVSRRAVDNRFDAFDVGLPGSVGSSVRMGNPNAKSDPFAANFTLGHVSAPPSWIKPYKAT